MNNIKLYKPQKYDRFSYKSIENALEAAKIFTNAGYNISLITYTPNRVFIPAIITIIDVPDDSIRTT